jgi:hypothetical protein
MGQSKTKLQQRHFFLGTTDREQFHYEIALYIHISRLLSLLTIS